MKTKTQRTAEVLARLSTAWQIIDHRTPRVAASPFVTAGELNEHGTGRTAQKDRFEDPAATSCPDPFSQLAMIDE